MLKQLCQFGVVGFSGLIVNIVVFYLSNSSLGLNPNFSSTFAFILSATGNYTLNRSWTFKTAYLSKERYLKGLVKYVFYNIIGFCVTLVALNITIYISGTNSIIFGQLLGVSAGIISNFTFAKFHVFRKNA